jgi:Selenocysteine lyase
VAQAWGEKFIREGDVILLTVMEHHSNLVPWQLLAERKGARLRFLPVRDDGTLDVDQLSSLLTPEVKLFASHTSQIRWAQLIQSPSFAPKLALWAR